MSIADKRAALELHRLAPQDREWVLGRLASSDRARVAPVLAELDAMNIRFDIGNDASLAPVAANSRAAAKGIAAIPPDTSVESIIRHASHTDVLDALSGEPEWLLRMLFALDDWPWVSSVERSLAQAGVLRLESSAPRGRSSLPSG